MSRHFCPTCGSFILSRNSGYPDLVFISASSLDDPDAVAPTMIVFASSAPKWARLDPTLPAYVTNIGGDRI